MLIVLFALQHSVMARQKFKLIVIKVIPKAVERSTYVLLSGACVILITLYWQPIAGSVWVVDNSLLTIILRIIHIIGWLIMVGATFEIDHLHLMGLKQVFLNYAKYSVTEPLFSEKYLYKIVRHPIQLGVLIVIWATPHMTMTLFMLSTILTIYIFIGLYFEELSLVASLGETYKDYQRRVPKVVPFLKCI
jgi:protein-S-isoprenylcysteine O-methyltransferase Ste14